MPAATPDQEPCSDNDGAFCTLADSKIVMAEQSAQDVVNQSRSVGDSSLADDIAINPNHAHATEGVEDVEDRPAHASALVLKPSEPTPDPVKLSTLQINGLIQDQSEVADEAKDIIINSTTLDQTDGTESEALSGREDILEQPSQAEISGGSDTDTSRQDTTRAADKDAHDSSRHVRSNSLKKPASFKAVSVTKNFLAKAVAGSVPPLKLGGEKGPSSSTNQAGTANQPPPRPRLVAKSGSGLRDAAPRASAASPGAGRGNGPDASQVWNKNRPAQPAAPKHFTDEELKQQYGIHLATRLQSDEGKEAKWADIDDDDDDWAPETIEWNDGTKITLAQQEETPLPSQTQSTDIPKDVFDGGDRIRSPAAGLSNDAGTDMAIPKASTPSNGQSRTGGLVLKGAPEKPVLVAKPPVPTPVKSPWASLPPVEKVPPIIPDSQHAPQFSRGSKDFYGSDSMPPSQSPATEIAADDFNRSWRDGHSGASRELFNSQSGRYEPVNDARRGSIRNDAHYRQPSVLQRPSQGDAIGPAEPSAAFQTHRSSLQEESWGRRRTSSNVSGGSGMVGRRMSSSRPDMPLPHAFSGQRRGSQHAMVMDHAQAPYDMPSPQLSQSSSRVNGANSPSQMHYHQSRQSHASPVLNHAQPTGAYVPGLQGSGAIQGQHTPAEDPVEMQKKIMRESRELAMKRRKEQEEKEESERKERIRMKMEALGMPPPGAKDRKDSNQVEVLSSKTGTTTAEQPKEESSLQSSRPFASDASAQTKKYGSMRVHQAKPAGAGPTTRSESVQGPAGLGPSGQGTPAGSLPMPEVRSDLARMQNGVSQDDSMDRSHAELQNDSMASSNLQKTQDQPWKNVPAGSDTFTSWGATGMTTHSSAGGNLWGPPSNDKALGNGTFDRGYGRLPPRPSTQEQKHMSSPAPGPIGPPNAAQRSGAAAQSRQEAATRSMSGVEGQQQTSRFSPTQGHVTPRVNQSQPGSHRLVSGEDGSGLPGPIGRPATSANMASQRRSQAVSAWKALPAQLEREDAESRERAAKDLAAQREEEARTGVKREGPMPAFKETWRQVAVDETSNGPRKVVGVTRTVSGADAPEARLPETPRSHPAAPIPITPAGAASTSHPAGGVRGSRFFPQATVGGNSQARPSTAIGHAETQFGSSPPPDSSTHPAYDGDVNRPQVLLPTPKPVVKLPPSLTELNTTAPSTQRPGPKVGPLPSNPTEPKFSWQDRINGLFGTRKQASPPKTHTTPIAQNAQTPSEVPVTQHFATHALPREENGSTWHDTMPESGEPTTRATEEALLEEREFGSLPTVRLPDRAPSNAWQPARAPLTPRSRSRFQKPVQVLSIEPYVFRARETPQGTVIEIMLPGTEKSTTVTKPHSTTSPRAQRTVSSNPHWKDKRKPAKPRESSAGYGTQRTVQSGTPRTSLHSANWTRRVSSAAH